MPHSALRPATFDERRAAGAYVGDAKSPVGCMDCVRLEAARRQAVAECHDHDAVVDATVAIRSHFRDAHLLFRTA
ncbi:hypothetical protein GCM10010218_31150 [Streptomyces mashuensis]|uniref:Uncharacterized protein n=1 Tax=Streptomyces mashuensis TaxID=33904 RepID=A0A919B2W3_9ACTN|nr:hypothetical protein GCM10010218_31150 [Streptomyces mashuensis]